MIDSNEHASSSAHEASSSAHARGGAEGESLRRELSGQTGRQFWKSLDQAAETEGFQRMVERDFPAQHSALMDPPQRRTVLKLMGASLALAGFNACSKQPEERIVPFAKNPEAIVPGVPLFFATAMPWSRGSIGLLVENHMGRPTKIEGNPDHPASLGATDSFAQASVLDLYDPDRSRDIVRRGRTTGWDKFQDELRAAANVQGAKQGAGLRILCTPVVSPTLGQQLRDVLAAFPRARIHQYEPVNRDNAAAGARAAFGRDVAVQALYDRAELIVSLECDFLAGGPQSVRATKDFSKGRRARKDQNTLSRLYAIESAYSITGSLADHRLALRPSEIEAFARKLAGRLGVDVQAGGSNGAHDAFLTVLAKDLEARRGKSLVVAGDCASPAVHALAHAINARLGNVGATVRYLPPVECFEQQETQLESITRLVADMRAGAVDTLLILGGNPLYDAPADLEFKSALEKVALRVHLSQREDETSFQCDWHVPEAHYLESWSDARSLDGTVTIVQPLIAPLYNGKSAHEVLNVLLARGGESAYDAIRAYWQKQKGDNFEKSWRSWLHQGVIAGSAATALEVSAKRVDLPVARTSDGIEVAFRPDPTVWDGRFANNGWLQECPKPISKLTWDAVVQLSPRTAAKLGLASGAVAEITLDGRKISLPVWIGPGHADDCATVHLGYGRTRAGKVGDGVGIDAYPLRTTLAFDGGLGAKLAATGASIELASTQEHHDFDVIQLETAKRAIVRVRTIET